MSAKTGKEKKPKKYHYFTKTIPLPDGTRKYIRAKTQEELDQKVLEAQMLMRSGVDISNDETFAHFAQTWYDVYKKPYLRENSQNAIKYVLNQHILPYLGGYRVRDITPLQIQAIMAGLSGKSNSLQAKVLVSLRSIFKAAQENGLVARSPVSSTLKAGGKTTQEKVALTPSESRLLLDRVENPRARTFLLIALHTGMRRGEILALRWEDIDFVNKVIHVQRNAVMTEEKTTVSEEMKTRAAKRDVPLSEELEEWLIRQKPHSHSQYVIAMQNHQPLTKSSYKSMGRLIERELPDTHVSAHILRHTYITRLFEAGLDIKEIQYLAGHSTVEMTLRVYTHYDRRSREAQTSLKVREALRAKPE
ncbi:MAG: site-specific integrase [Oscillibacter sp.]|nr:site-specific integrase [Oscillibacter sp.]